MRATLKTAATDMSIRRFLGFGLTERLPDHSTFSHAQTRRFADSSVFEQLFTAVLRQCTQAGLVGGRRLLIDATHVEADAALKSLRAELAPASEGDDPDADADAVAQALPSRPKLALAAPRTGPTPKRTASNATAVLRSDPDAKLRHKPGHRVHLVHRAQVAVDPKARVTVAVQAEPATGSEAGALEALIGRARFAGHTAREVGADAGYASLASYAKLQALDTIALIPPQPGAQHPAAHAARERMNTPTGRDTAIDRQTHAEGAISELKHHGMSRARCRGTRKTQLQLLAAATAINLKRLLDAGKDRTDSQPGNAGSTYTTITGLLTLLGHCLAEIAHLTPTQTSTSS
jgi:hypothetical protein